jgi:periplasmic divalent cation tolerance protein
MEMGQSQQVRVETTTDSREAAAVLARSVVDARLVACAQLLGPITSFYRWEGEVQEDEEWLLVMKTATDRLPELTAHIRREHSYDVPEVVAVPVTGGDEEYLDWVVAETRDD